MYKLEDIFVNSRFIDNDTLVDVVHRIGDWLEVKENNLNDDYVQKQIKFLIDASKENKQKNFYPELKDVFIPTQDMNVNKENNDIYLDEPEI